MTKSGDQSILCRCTQLSIAFYSIQNTLKKKPHSICAYSPPSPNPSTRFPSFTVYYQRKCLFSVTPKTMLSPDVFLVPVMFYFLGFISVFASFAFFKCLSVLLLSAETPLYPPSPYFLRFILSVGAKKSASRACALTSPLHALRPFNSSVWSIRGVLHGKDKASLSSKTPSLYPLYSPPHRTAPPPFHDRLMHITPLYDLVPLTHPPIPIFFLMDILHYTNCQEISPFSSDIYYPLSLFPSFLL